MADVRTIQGDTAITPFGAGTGGSRSGSMTAGAIAETARGLRERIVAIAAHRLGTVPDEIDFVNSIASVRNAPDKSLSLAEIAVLPTSRARRSHRASRPDWRRVDATGHRT